MSAHCHPPSSPILRADNGIRALIQLLQLGAGGSGPLRINRGALMGIATARSMVGGGAGGLASGGAGGESGLPGGGDAASVSEKIRALAARCLLGLARDPSIKHILAKLQVCW